MKARRTESKYSFINTVKGWTVFFLLVLAAALLIIQTISSKIEATSRAGEMRSEYMEDQRQLIKFEVDRVVKVIDYETDKCLQAAKAEVKLRVLEAHSIARNLYRQNMGFKTDREIQKIIIDALRPARFNDGRGYYFICDFQGVAKLFADRPSREGSSLIDSRDTRGRYVVRDIVDIVKSQGEGFYSYHWSKPGHSSNDFEKISYVKHFEPFDWFIGTGTYPDSVEIAMQKIIASYVATHRFGPRRRGYVFINELLDIRGGKKFARVYANPNRPGDTGKAISDEYKDAKGKMFRKAFLKGLRDSGQCYVDYWYKKIGSPKPSPKTSFFRLAADDRFIVAAGVYLDDVEEQVLLMQAQLKKQLRRSYFIICSVFIVILSAVLLSFNLLNRRLKEDFYLFGEFFKRAANSSESIDRDAVRFSELDRLAEYANRMLAKKNETEDNLREEREKLTHWVSELERAKSALRKSEEEYRVLVENARDAIFVYQDGGMKFCNPVTEEITGYDPGELSSISLRTLVHPDDFDFVCEQHEGRLSGREMLSTYPFKLMRKDKEIVWVQIGVVLVEWENRPATLNFMRDMTTQRNLEQQLVQSQKMQAVGTLAGGIAHDFNNILSGIFGYSQLAKTNIENPVKAAENIDQVLNGAKRASELVRQILTVSRRAEYKKTPVSIYLVAKEAIKFLRSSIPANIEIQEKILSRATVLADPTQIHQIIMNLCTNGYQAMRPKGGVLSLRLVEAFVKESSDIPDLQIPPGHYVRLEVSDTGVGMDAATLGRIFEPYFTTKAVGEGSGLGLAVVLGIVESHKGHIRAHSEAGKGATFNVYLPVVTAQDEAPAPAKKRKGIIGGTEKIMLVDDDEGIRGATREMLTHYGYRVTACCDGEQALEEFKKDPARFDLILSDVTMPKMNGNELAKEILSIRGDMGVILCSGYNADLSTTRALAPGIRKYLQKPIDGEYLLVLIRDILDEK